MKKWQKKILKVVGICVIILYIHFFTGAREYVEVGCRESITIQTYPMLDFGCGVLTLDWKRIDTSLSQIKFFQKD